MNDRTCATGHTHIRFSLEDDEFCPLCIALAEKDEALAKRDEEIAALSARVEELLEGAGWPEWRPKDYE